MYRAEMLMTFICKTKAVYGISEKLLPNTIMSKIIVSSITYFPFIEPPFNAYTPPILF